MFLRFNFSLMFLWYDLDSFCLDVVKKTFIKNDMFQNFRLIFKVFSKIKNLKLIESHLFRVSQLSQKSYLLLKVDFCLIFGPQITDYFGVQERVILRASMIFVTIVILKKVDLQWVRQSFKKAKMCHFLNFCWLRNFLREKFLSYVEWNSPYVSYYFLCKVSIQNSTQFYLPSCLRQDLYFHYVEVNVLQKSSTKRRYSTWNSVGTSRIIFKFVFKIRWAINIVEEFSCKTTL